MKVQGLTSATTGLLGLGLAAAVACAAPLAAPVAHANSAAADYFMSRADRTAVPKLLTEDERAYYRDLFGAIKREDWSRAQVLFAQKPDGPLTGTARAEYFLAASSPKIDLASLQQWLATTPYLPQAEQIEALAAKRGATSLPALAQPQALMALPSAQRRARPRDVADGTMPAMVASAINDHIKTNDTAGAQVLLDGVDGQLSPAARAEWRQKVAWSYYISNDDTNALAMAQSAVDGSGAWVADGWWTVGLAAWRLGDCLTSGDAFAKAARSASNSELAAAAYYWQSRSAVRCRQPEQAAAPLRMAAASDETLYGMLADEQLGRKLPTTHAGPDFTLGDWQRLREVPNVRVAVELAEVGEDGLADEVLRYQARIGSADQYQPLSRLARDLGLPATQLWMAYNAPVGGAPAPASRYPTPKWTPATGWQIDPALIFAHSLQESAFRADAVSPAGARGLMQIMPSAARDHAGELGVSGSVADLTQPSVNLAFGQAHLRTLCDSPGTQCLLPKVMAAYNAGLVPVARWNKDIHDNGDPLLWMESVPYWETRGYVATVFRNYWMYERQAGGPSESRQALAQVMWPTFPGLAGGKALRMAAKNTPESHFSGKLAEAN